MLSKLKRFAATQRPRVPLCNVSARGRLQGGKIYKSGLHCCVDDPMSANIERYGHDKAGREYRD